MSQNGSTAFIFGDGIRKPSKWIDGDSLNEVIDKLVNFLKASKAGTERSESIPKAIKAEGSDFAISVWPWKFDARPSPSSDSEYRFVASADKVSAKKLYDKLSKNPRLLNSISLTDLPDWLTNNRVKGWIARRMDGSPVTPKTIHDLWSR